MCTIHLISSYMCTLPVICFEDIGENTGSKRECSVLPSSALTLVKEYIHIKEECRTFLDQKSSSQVELQSDHDVSVTLQPTDQRVETVVVDDKHHVRSSPWMTFGALYLYDSDKESLIKGEWLNDAHMSVVQYLLNIQFPHLKGLQSVLLQTLESSSLQPLSKDSVQILHVNDNHWITVSTKTCAIDINVYDAMYSSLSKHTQLLLARLVHTDKKEMRLSLCNVNKQSGKSDCALFAAAYCTSIAYGQDPCSNSQVYDQQQMWEHLYKCFIEKRMDPFPVLRDKWVGPSRISEVPVCCYCRCEDWFHMRCVATKIRKGVWCCNRCQ